MTRALVLLASLARGNRKRLQMHILSLFQLSSLSLLSHPQDFVILNVGGKRHEVKWSTLDKFPTSRLGRLRRCVTLRGEIHHASLDVFNELMELDPIPKCQGPQNRLCLGRSREEKWCMQSLSSPVPILGADSKSDECLDECPSVRGVMSASVRQLRDSGLRT